MYSDIKAIDKLSQIDKEQIQSVLAASNFASPFHSLEWNKVIYDTFNVITYYFLLYNGKQLVGLFPFIKTGNPVFFQIHSFSSYYENTYGGPLVVDDDPELSILIIRMFARNLGFLSYIGVELPPNYPIEYFENKKFLSRHIYDTPIVDLRIEAKQIWSTLDYKKVRWGIEKSNKEGVKLRINNSDDLDYFYQYLKSIYDHFDKKILPFDYYKKLFMKKLVYIFSAIYKDKPIAVMLIAYHNKTIYYWAGASSFEYRKLCPNDFLLWEIIKWGQNNAYQKFDLLRMSTDSESPDGIRGFKIKFEGDIVPLYHVHRKTKWYYVNRTFDYICHPYHIVKILKK